MLNPVTSRKVFERFLTEAEERQLLRTIKRVDDALARRDLAWMTLLRQTGIRVGALSKLTCGDARDALRRGELELSDEISKGHRGYAVHLNKAAQGALRTLLRERREQGFPERADDPLVMSRKGNGLAVRSFQSRMQAWVREARLPVSASPHWLRHTLARRVMDRSESSDPRSRVQLILGHRYRDTTAIYTLPTREEIANELEAAS
jgi:site-specific recombinase XerC